MRRVLWASIIAACAAIAGCAAPRSPQPQAAAAPPPPGAAGATVSCIEINRIREARVVDDRTIDFILSDRRTLRNTLPYSCPQLGSERAFSYATSINQLCSVDIITVILQGGGPRRGASCGLGPFVPYTPIPAAK